MGRGGRNWRGEFVGIGDWESKLFFEFHKFLNSYEFQ